MNTDIFRYKCSFITLALLLGYAYMHMSLSGLYSELTWDELINFRVRLPYAQRLLVPAMVRLFSALLPVKLEILFFFMEWLFTSLLYFTLFHLLQQEFNWRQSQLLSWLFLLILPLVTVINYRFQRQGVAPVFSPGDTATLFFFTMGFLLSLSAKWLYFIPLVFLATLNRESSFLLVCLVPALHWHHLKSVIRPTILALFAYIAARFLILTFLEGVPGPLLEWYPRGGANTLFKDNLLWLLNEGNILLLMFCFAGLPLFWFAFFDYIPLRYRPLRYVLVFYFIALLMVGRLMEARIFSEIIVLIYFPICLALNAWLFEQQPIPSNASGLGYIADRWAVIGILLISLGFWQPINKAILRFLV
jgi:hypothetical protein